MASIGFQDSRPDRPATCDREDHAGTVDLPPVRVAVVGLGRAGTFHLERLGLRDDFRIVSAFDQSSAAMDKAAGLVPRFATSWSGLMGDSSADLVILATPPSTHAPLAVELLRAGKHVLVETPLCLSLAEADMILDAARQANRSIICAQTRRWDDDFQTVLRTVAGGTLGKPRIVKYVNWHFGPARHDSSDWRGDPLSGGGPMWEFGVHLFDQLLQLAGEFPREVFTVLPPAAGRRVDVEAGFLSLVRFPSGLMSQIEVHCETPVPFQTGWIVVGSEGSCQGGTQFTVTAEGEVVDEPLGPIAGGPDDFYAAVARHLREGEPNPVGAEEARRTISVLVAARQSAQTGRPAPVEA